jgi:DNA-binding transcriptional LysR family regulator
LFGLAMPIIALFAWADPWADSWADSWASPARAESIVVDGVTRTFVAQLAATKPAPLVIVLHGNMQTSAEMVSRTSWPAVARREQVSAVFPDGLNRAWEDLRPHDKRAARPPPDGSDDVAFIAKLVEKYVASGVADPKRVYVTGVSASVTPLLLTAPPMFARQYLFGDRFLKWCDTNTVRLEVTDAKRDLFGPDQIVAIRLGIEPAHDLSVTPLLGVKLVLAAAPQLASDACISEAGWWSKQNLLTPSVSEVAWEKAWLALGLNEKVTPRHRRFSSYAAALEAACASQGILLAALPFVEREFSTGRLARLSKIRISSPIGYSLAMRTEVATTRRGRALRQKLISEIRR